MQQASARRKAGIPCLVAFPEFVGLPLLFVDAAEELQGCTRWREAGRRLIGKYSQEVETNCRQFGVTPIRGLLLARGDTVRKIFTETFSEAARRHRCYVVAGSAPLPGTDPDGKPDGSVYNTSLFFGPDGALIGSQNKVHPYGAQGTSEGLDLSAGKPEEIRTFATPVGRVGIAVCYDAWQDDVVRKLAEQRATLLVQPSANAHAWDAWQQKDWKRGLWRQVQRYPSFSYGVNPMMVGWLFAPDDEYACDGRSSVVAKAVNTPGRSGYLVQAAEPQKGSPATEQVIAIVVPVKRGQMVPNGGTLRKTGAPLWPSASKQSG